MPSIASVDGFGPLPAGCDGRPGTASIQARYTFPVEPTATDVVYRSWTSSLPMCTSCQLPPSSRLTAIDNSPHWNTGKYR